MDVTAICSTRNRYDSLAMLISAVCMQTLKPKEFIIYDDGEHKDLRGDNTFSHLFQLMSFKGIDWKVQFGAGQGQVLNHIRSLKEAKCDFIYRIDDDCIPEPDVLEKLCSLMVDDVGAVGGLVIDKPMPKPAVASNKIEDIYLGMNEQWFVHPEGSKPKEVDHLYSSFLYRKSIAEYCAELSKKCHREETMLTYSFVKKGYRNILEPNAITWHFSCPSGGIRG